MTGDGLDLSLSEEQVLVRSLARDFARDRLLPLAAVIDEREAVPPEVLRECAALGFMGMTVPERWGGAGLTALSYVHVLEELSRACASTGVIVSVNNSLVCEAVLHHGTDAQRQRWLLPLTSGVALGCFALTEPGGGSDPKAMLTTARRDGEGWSIDGTKSFVTSGASAGVVVVFARTDPAARDRGIAAFVLDVKTPGLAVGKVERKLGIRGSDTAQLHFADCRVPGDALLGEVGGGLRIALKTLDGGRIGIAAQAVGIARACYEDALAYAKEREAFGQRIADFQAIKWKLADLATELDAARLLTWRAAALKDDGLPYRRAAAQAKLFASDVAVRAARECVQIFGGYGYLAGCPAERHYRDAKVTELYEGTSEILRLVIAAEILAE